MSISVITGSGGLIGSEAALHFGRLGFEIVGIDNDMRGRFFGSEASTRWNVERLSRALGSRYLHLEEDIRSREAMLSLFDRFGKSIELVIHTAAQPSHDWAAREPFTDFDINASGTMNLLEATRLHAPEATFIFTSTNKVYGDSPNRLPLIEQDTRYEIDPAHDYADGIREDMSVDHSLHSLFGASKLAADVMVQEYGRYFEMSTACFRGGTLTGPVHSAVELHGFLGYVMRCAMTGTRYTIYGYKGKQVRDAIHSLDLIRAFDLFREHPSRAAVYNIGGGRFSNCSVIEAIRMVEEITGREIESSYADTSRKGDHIWWIGDNGKFESEHPQWRLEYNVRMILEEMFELNKDRWKL